MFQGRTRDAPHVPDLLLSLDSEHNLSMHEKKTRKTSTSVSRISYRVVHTENMQLLTQELLRPVLTSID